MRLLPPKIDDAHARLFLMLLGGAGALLLAIFGTWIGGMPDGNRYHPDMITREEQPVKFWLMVVLMSVVGVSLLVCGVVKLLFT